MTIDELLKIAQDEIADAQTWVFEESAAEHAAIAQAAATTAHVMLMRDVTYTTSTGSRVINIDTGN